MVSREEAIEGSPVAVKGLGRRHSGNSFSKRSMMRSRVESRNLSRSVAVS